MPLADDAGVAASRTVSDGDEVEILAWRPRGAGGPRYRVRSMKDGSEGWLTAEHLRTLARPEATPAPVAAPPATVEDPGRKFGQRTR